MNAVEDFTSLPIGTEVLVEGWIARCPMCGKNAVEHKLEAGGAYWVHRQTTALLCDGLRVDFDEVCEPNVEARPS